MPSFVTKFLEVVTKILNIRKDELQVNFLGS